MSGEADRELTRVSFTCHSSGPIFDTLVQSMNFYGITTVILLSPRSERHSIKLSLISSLFSSQDTFFGASKNSRHGIYVKRKLNLK